MKNIIIFLTILVYMCNSSYSSSTANVNVIASITPIASLVAMIGGDKVSIHSIMRDTGCPHHHTLKPSDMRSIEDADLYVYIDDKFDGFGLNIATKIRGKSLAISKMRDITVDASNWHLWLMPRNAMVILKNVTDALTEISPENKDIFQSSYNMHMDRLRSLEKRRINILSSISNMILLSDSVEYIFLGFGSRYKKLYKNYEDLSINSIHTLSNIDDARAICFISNIHDSERYKKLINADIVGISTENWILNGPLSELYYTEYYKILDTIQNACNHHQ